LATPVDLAAAWRFRRAVWEQAAKGKSGAGRGGADRRKSRQIGFEEAGLEAIRVGSEEKKAIWRLTPDPSPGYFRRMKFSPSMVVIAGVILFPLGNLRAEVREWTRASDGRKIKAEFVELKDESTVKIKLANGQIFEVPLTGLSAEDNAFVKEASAKMTGGSATPGKAPATGSSPAVPEGETTVTLSNVHLCCGDCADAVAKIGTSDTNPIPSGVTITADRKAGAIVVKAPSGKDAQAALRAVFKAGFYGVSDQPAVSIAELKADEFTTDTMIIRDTHLCCGGCVKAFSKAVETVDGVESCEAKVGSSRVQVTGKGFKTYEVMKALREAGFAGIFQ